MATLVARPAIEAPATWALFALVPAAAAAAVDTWEGRVPDRLVALSALVAVAAVVFGSVDAASGSNGSDGSGVVAVAAGALAVAGPLLALHLVSPAVVGFGDVKLAAALGAAVGLVDVRRSIWVLAIASGATLLVALVCRARSMAFAPGLVLGTALVIVGPSLATEISR